MLFYGNMNEHKLHLAEIYKFVETSMPIDQINVDETKLQGLQSNLYLTDTFKTLASVRLVQGVHLIQVLIHCSIIVNF